MSESVPRTVSVHSQIFILFMSNGEKILSNVNVVVRGQVKREYSSLPVAVRVSKTRVLKLPTYIFARAGKYSSIQIRYVKSAE